MSSSSDGAGRVNSLRLMRRLDGSLLDARSYLAQYVKVGFGGHH